MGVGPYDKEAFEFAKDMGIETLVSEPKFDDFDAIDKLCEEYKINVAIHDHPKPSPYWNPDTVLKVCKDRSKRIGACCDTGHWMRSDLIPVECLRKLEGRIISFHVKDLNEFGLRAQDVPWGTGRGDIKGMLTEVKRQGIKPVFSMEYESKFTMPELAQCVAYFDKVSAELEKLQQEIAGLRTKLKSKPDLLHLLPDVQIYEKAVRYALEYNEFFNAREIPVAKELLKQGLERASALSEGKAPWTAATGL